MRYEVSQEEIKQAENPHQWFLVNLITNHILLFVGILSASSLQQYVVVVPIISLVLLTYILWGAKRARLRSPWYVNCHWQVAARRSRIFIVMLAIMGLVILAVLLVSGGNPRPQHFAFGGVGILPTMIAVLVLIVMEQDAMNQARNGLLPKWVVERYPNPEAKVIDQQEDQPADA